MSVAAIAFLGVRPACGATAEGTFKPEWGSLQQYKCPEWFGDAKFGIWAHWGPRCVPMWGDWYAKNMYVPGAHRGQYAHHVEAGHFKEDFNFTAKDIRFTRSKHG